MTISTAIDQSSIARVVGIKTAFKNLRGANTVFLPQRVIVVGQGNSAAVYSNDKRQVTSAYEAGSLYGFGSPVHLATKQLLPENGDGVGSIPVTIYPLDDHGSGTTSTGKIVAAGTQTQNGEYYVSVNNIRSESFSIVAGELGTALEGRIADAISAILDMPILATQDTGNNEIDLVSKWKGASANDIYIEVVGPDYGITFTITQMSGGTNNPDVDTAIAQIGNVWETLIVNCMEIADTTTLGKYATANEGRWGATFRKPFMVFTGHYPTSVSAAIAVSDTRKTDRTNSAPPSPVAASSMHDLPLVIAARAVARIAVMANNNPAHDYGSLQLTGLTPGADSAQWNFIQRDTALKGGCSTIEVRDGVVNISDSVTFYHPDGDPNPGYRYVVDVIKLMNVIFNIDLAFANSEWDGAPVVPDDQPTTNPTAKKPKSYKGRMAQVVDALGLDAIISDPEFSKSTIQAGINGSNPKRVDMTVTVAVSGNGNQTAVDLNFGFFFGG